MMSLGRGLFWIFAIIGVVASLVSALLVLISRDKQTPAFAEARPSPDGKFKVLKFVSAGGGGLSPYCIEQLEVVPADAPNEWQKQQYVFSGDCSVNVSYEWTSANDVKVSYTVHRSASEQYFMKGADESKRIRVTFEARSGPF